MRWHWVVIAGWMVSDCGQQAPATNVVPAPPNASAWGGGATVTFAVNRIFLGDTDRNGNTTTKLGPPAPANGCIGTSAGPTYMAGNDWAGFGYDLDHRATTLKSIDVCTLAQGAPHSVQVDGLNGNDNSWGENIISVVIGSGAGATLSASETAIVTSGQWTLQIQVDGMPADDAVGVHARIFVSGPFDQGAPAFDGTTDWPVLASAVQDGASITSGAVVFDNDAYVTNGTFVMRPASSLHVPLEASSGARGVGIIHHPVVTFALPTSGSSSTLTNGTIAGVLDTTEFIDAVRTVAGGISPALCGPAIVGILNQIIQQQDILIDETNASGVACDAISVGIGFNAALVANPTKVSPDPAAPPNLCNANDAGVDATRD